MKVIRRFSVVILMIFSLITICFFSGCEEKPSDVVVLYTNDIHCAVNADSESGIIGYSKLAQLKKDIAKFGTPVVLVDAGDAIMGEPIGAVSEGENIIKIMNLSCYDYAIPGNHEFDYGMDRFLELTEMADFKYLSCNFKNLETDSLVLPVYDIKEIGGRKIAFIGVTTPATLSSSSPTSFMDDNMEYIYNFCQDKTGEALYNQVQQTVDEVINKGADYVVVIAHLGIEASCSPWMSTELVENTTGIDVVIDGHSHSILEQERVKNADGKSVILTSTGTKFANIGKLTISADGTVATELINESEAELAESTILSEKIQTIESEFEAEMQQIVAHSDVDLVINDPLYENTETPVRLIRITETNLGNLCADAYRSVTGADISFVNGGGVRDSIKAGDITYEDIIKVNPFGNYICMIEATGQQIIDMLEHGVRSLPAEDGTFQQVSGMTFDIDVRIPSSVIVDEQGMFIEVTGEYRIKNVKINDEDIDLNKTYTLASHDYLLKELGGGATMFTGCNMILDSIMLDNQALITYITQHLNGVISEKYSDPYGDGRITILQ